MLSFVTIQMDLEDILVSEICQTKKDEYLQELTYMQKVK
jgi:hypothetical protein